MKSIVNCNASKLFNYDLSYLKTPSEYKIKLTSHSTLKKLLEIAKRNKPNA